MINLIPMMQNVCEISKFYLNVKWLILTQRKLKKKNLSRFISSKMFNQKVFFLFKIKHHMVWLVDFTNSSNINNFYVRQVLPADEKNHTLHTGSFNSQALRWANVSHLLVFRPLSWWIMVGVWPIKNCRSVTLWLQLRS